MRIVAFWFWFVAAVFALARLWNTMQSGGLAQAGVADAVAFAALVLALWLIARAQVRAARADRRSR